MDLRRMSSYDPRGVRTPESAAEAKESLSKMMLENDELKDMLTRTLDELEGVCKREDESLNKLKKLEKGLGVEVAQSEVTLPETIDAMCNKLSRRQKLSQLEQEFQLIGLKIDGVEKKLQAKLLQVCLASSQDDMEDMLRSQEILRLEEKAREHVQQNVLEEAAVDLARQQMLISATEKHVQDLTNEVKMLRDEKARYSQLENELGRLRARASKMQSDKERILLLEQQIALLKGPRGRRWQVPARIRNDDSTPSSASGPESDIQHEPVNSMAKAMSTPLHLKGKQVSGRATKHPTSTKHRSDQASPSDYPTESPYTPPSPTCHGLARVGTGRVIVDEDYVPLTTELEKTESEYEPDEFSPEDSRERLKDRKKSLQNNARVAQKGKENMPPKPQSKPRWRPPASSTTPKEPESGTTIHTHLSKEQKNFDKKQVGQEKKKRKLLNNTGGQEYADTLPANLLFGDIHNFKIPKLRK